MGSDVLEAMMVTVLMGAVRGFSQYRIIFRNVFCITLLMSVDALNLASASASASASAGAPRCESIHKTEYWQEIAAHVFRTHPATFRAMDWDPSIEKSEGSSPASMSRRERAALEKFLVRLKARGGDGKFGAIEESISFEAATRQEAEAEIAILNANAPDSSPLRLQSYKNGRAVILRIHSGILLNELPASFSPETKERHRTLTSKGISFLVSESSEIPYWVGAMLYSHNSFIQGRASGLVFIRPEGLGQIFLNHEMQHAFDLVVETDNFLKTLPELSYKSGALVARQFRGDEPMSWIANQRAGAVVELPGVAAELKASTESLRHFFSRRGLKQLVLNEGRGLEFTAALVEMGQYSFRNFHFAYLQTWIDPRNPRIFIHIFKGATIGSVFVMVAVGRLAAEVPRRIFRRRNSKY